MNKVNAFVGQVPEKFSSKRRVPKLPLIIIAILAGSIGTYALIRSFAATPNCDQTVSSVSAAQSAVSSAAGGTTVCMANGSYGKITLSATKTSAGVTLQAQNPGQATVDGFSLSGAYLTIAQFNITDEVTIQPGSTGMTVYHNTISGGYMGVTGCASTTTACYDTKIIGNKFQGPYGEDAIRANRYEDSANDADTEGLTVSQNEITGVVENGNHSDCLQAVWVGNNITFDHNYEHDNRCQGFFIKDQDSLCASGSGNVCGTVHNVKVLNNLFTRNSEPCAASAPGCGQPTTVQLFGPEDGVIIDRNTIWTGSLLLRDPGWANVSVTNNVTSTKSTDTSAPFNATYSASNNLFCSSNYSGSWPNTGFTSNCNPAFPAPTKAGGDDFRLGGSQGVDWVPSQYTYGPQTSGVTPPPSDTTAPTISLTAPAANATVSGTATTVSATASDDTGVSGVQFKLDGNNLGSEDTSSPYSTTWNTTSASNGTHTLTAVARDAAGNTKTSSSVSVTVNNATASGKRYVATNGNDSGNNCLTQSSPCLTFDRAYSQAALGDTVEVAAGTYGGQSINEQSAKELSGDQPDVVFKPASGAVVTVASISSHASHITIQDMKITNDVGFGQYDPIHSGLKLTDITLKNLDGRNLNLYSTTDVDVIGGDWGPASDCGGPYGGSNNSIRRAYDGSAYGTNPNNIVFDGVTIHDIQTYNKDSCHMEGLAIFAGNNITVKNSKFYGNSIYDIFLQSNSGPISNITFENNWFGMPTGQAYGAGGGSSTIAFSGGSSDFANSTIRHNSFNGNVSFDDNGLNPNYTNFKIIGNIGTAPWNLCSLNVAAGLSYNVWKSTTPCNSTERNLNGAAFPFVNTADDASMNYHLKAGSVAIDLVPAATSGVTKDIDGDSRPQGSASDAGADETTGTTPPPPSDTAAPTVAFSSPTNGATVSGTVTATATATDDTGVTKVEISLDSSLKMTDTAAPYNYSFDSKTLSNGSHTLTAKAYDAAGNTKSVTITITVSNPDTTPPNAPTNLNATAPTSTSVNLTWTAATDTGTNPSGVTKYNVLRNGVVIAQPTTTSYTDTGRTANTTYSYVVQAVDAAGNVSANSNTDSVTTPPPPTTPDTTAPTVPGNVAATAASPNQVNISWNASTDSGGSGLAGYNVYRGSTKLNSSPVTTTTYGDSTAAAGTAYSYKVEAVDGAGNKSAQSSSATVTTPAAKRGDITGSSGAPDGKIDLTDISYVIRKYNTTDANGDISGPNGTPDGKVDLFDLSYIIRNYGK